MRRQRTKRKRSMLPLFSWLLQRGVTPDGLLLLYWYDNQVSGLSVDFNEIGGFDGLLSNDYIALSDQNPDQVVLTLKGKVLLDQIEQMPTSVGGLTRVTNSEPTADPLLVEEHFVASEPEPIVSNGPKPVDLVKLRQTAQTDAETDRYNDKTKPMRHFDEWIESYRVLFPKGLNGNTPYRSSKLQLKERFEWFFKHSKGYSWADVIAATEEYMRVSKPEYKRAAHYFVRKSMPDRTIISELAGFCELVCSPEYYEQQAHNQQQTDRGAGFQTIV